MTAALDAQNLRRDFGTTPALHDLTLALPAGAITALLGPNGAGKTTFLKLAAGLLAPTHGSIRLLGHDPRDPRHPPTCGWLDDHGPPHWLTLHNLANLQAEATRSFDRAQFDALLARRNLSPRLNYGSLSKGQRRWTQAALLFASAAPILFLDEPADGLDPESRADLYTLLRQHVSRHDAAAVVATHALADIESVADHITILSKGRLLLSDDLELLRATVRQATLSRGEPLPDLPLLAHAPDPEGDTIWFTTTPDDPLPPNTRHVDLESLYLALLRHGLPKANTALPPVRSSALRR